MRKATISSFLRPSWALRFTLGATCLALLAGPVVGNPSILNTSNGANWTTSGNLVTVGGTPQNMTALNLSPWTSGGVVILQDQNVGRITPQVQIDWTAGGSGLTPRLTLSSNPTVSLSGSVSGSNPTSLTLSANLNPSLAQPAFPATVPAARPNSIPGTVSTLTPTSSLTQFLASQASTPSLAHARPDFRYAAQRLEFEKVPESSTTGQRDLGVGPGVPANTTRFIPVGEY